MKLMRNFFQLVFISSILSTNNLIWAQAYPNKPVRLIVPQSAGGSSDAAARIIALKLSEVWKQNVVVENTYIFHNDMLISLFFLIIQQFYHGGSYI